MNALLTQPQPVRKRHSEDVCQGLARVELLHGLNERQEADSRAWDPFKLGYRVFALCVGHFGLPGSFGNTAEERLPRWNLG